MLFYVATHKHPGLASRRPLLKFLGVKLIVFATYYQALLVQLIPNVDRHMLEALNNFIFCFEMVFFALFYLWAFGWYEFRGGLAQEGLGEGLGEGPTTPPGGGGSMEFEIGEYSTPTRENAHDDVQGNAKSVFNMEDVVSDARENFSSKYVDHVRLDTSSREAALNEHLIVEEEEDEENSGNPFAVVEQQSQQRSFTPRNPTPPTKNPFQE